MTREERIEIVNKAIDQFVSTLKDAGVENAFCSAAYDNDPLNGEGRQRVWGTATVIAQMIDEATMVLPAPVYMKLLTIMTFGPRHSEQRSEPVEGFDPKKVN